MIRLGCHSANFGHNDIKDAFKFISELGFKYIDVSASNYGTGFQVDQKQILDKPIYFANKIKKLAERYGLELDELFLCYLVIEGNPVVANYPDKKMIQIMKEKFKTVCEYAKHANFKSIMISPGRYFETQSYKKCFDASVECLKDLVMIAAEYGLILRVEPSTNSILDTPNKVEDLISKIEGLEYTLDCLHFAVQGIEQKEYMKLVSKAGHMHARQAAKNWPKCPVEFGDIDYKIIVNELMKSNWDGVITMEFWNGEEQVKNNINPVFQNIVMAYEIKKHIKDYCEKNT